LLKSANKSIFVCLGNQYAIDRCGGMTQTVPSLYRERAAKLLDIFYY